MHSDDRPKTAFATRRGLFEFSVMPFGLRLVPATFERLMESVLAGLQRDIYLVYVDDFIVTGKTLEQMLGNLGKCFDRIKKTNLTQRKLFTWDM